MPNYEFICRDCKIIIDETHSMKDAPVETICPECNIIIPRYYSSMNFICKGEGWPSKNIRQGRAPVEDKQSRGLSAAKKLEDVQNARAKAGLNPRDKEVPMTEQEVKRRKQNIHRWIDEGK